MNGIIQLNVHFPVDTLATDFSEQQSDEAEKDSDSYDDDDDDMTYENSN